ncbi:MAG: glycosyltransferase [Planctomycetes bacterium]|nr:glycosyltransferase [Planctomycetota bacterium]
MYLRLLVVARLDELMGPYLAPLASHPSVGEVVVLRDAEGPAVPKARYRVPPKRFPGILHHAWTRTSEGIRMAHDRPFDAVVGFTYLPHGWVGDRIARRCGAPLHVHLPGADLMPECHGPMVRRWIVRRLNGCDTVSVTGSDHRARLLEAGFPEDRLFVLPKGIDAARFRPSGEARTYDVAFVGRLHPQKDPVGWLAAFAALRARLPAVRGVMLGDGPLAGAAREARERLGLATCVEMPGFRAAAETFLRRSRILLGTSRYEGLPHTVVEAMACGTPYVGYAPGSVRDAVRDGEDGILVEPSDPARLVEAAASLLSAPGRLSAMAGRAARVVERHHPEAARGVWGAVFARLGLAGSAAP